MARAGLAEWEVATPGGNVVCHADPYAEQHGTCLRAGDARGAAQPQPAIYVDHIEWWQYYRGYVVGKARGGFFVFREDSRQVMRFASEDAMRARVKSLAPGDPVTRPLTPADGWALTWAPIMKQRLAELKASGALDKMTPEQRKALEEQARSLSVPDIHPQAKK